MSQLIHNQIPDTLVMEYPFIHLITGATQLFGSNPFVEAYNHPRAIGYNPNRPIFTRITEEALYYLLLNIRISPREIYLGHLPYNLSSINHFIDASLYTVSDCFFQNDDTVDDLEQTGIVRKNPNSTTGYDYYDEKGNQVMFIYGIGEQMTSFIGVMYYLFVRLFWEQFPAVCNTLLHLRNEGLVVCTNDLIDPYDMQARRGEYNSHAPSFRSFLYHYRLILKVFRNQTP